MGLIQNLYWAVLRCLLGLRYRVKIQGMEQACNLEGPTLVLPNHPGYVDPPLVMSHLRIGKVLRPLVFSGMYRTFFLYPLMRLMNALEVPDLRAHSRDSHERAMQLIDLVVDRIEHGDSFIIYPAGRLQRTGRETIGGARMTQEILRRHPELNVVLVRTRGIWGSSFSCARTGDVPALNRLTLTSLFWMGLNLIFFAPRRQVAMAVEVYRASDLPVEDKTTLNRHLEDWYNLEGGEAPKFVPFHRFLGPRGFDYSTVATAHEFDIAAIKPATWQATYDLIEEHLGRPLEDSERDAHTTLDELGFDSLERMDMALNIEHQYGFRSDQVASTVGELAALASGLLAGSANEPTKVPDTWFRTSREDQPARAEGSTIADAFVTAALHNLDAPALADEISGVLTYRRLLVGASLMSRRMKTLQGDSVGIMLPASVAADLSFLALQFSGKLPVMLNWTTGPGVLAHAIEKLQVRHVITSHRFIDRLGVEIPGAEPVYLEDLRRSIGKVEAFLTLTESYLWPSRFRRVLPQLEAERNAVVLFTSGSESLPKAVPLTHNNLLANIKSGLQAMDFTRGDAMLGFLPPFHSFGLTANMLLPLLSGTRVVHYPDPTDSRALVRGIASYRPSLLFVTPTFLAYILDVSSPSDLRSLRLIMTGAEKCPEALRARCEETVPHATILEGYGITECSPVVSMNRKERCKPGTIGHPIECVEHTIVDPETHAALHGGETGILLVRGPTIFSGYLHHDGPSPFVEVAGKQWYNTGDLVSEDAEGYLHFRGRMKRFLKAGGEMISLPALEEPFQTDFPPDEQGPRVAVEGIEMHDGRHIVLFQRGAQLSLREANARLKSAGFRGVMRLDAVHPVDQIPVLGTGKTDYKALRQRVTELVEQMASR